MEGPYFAPVRELTNLSPIPARDKEALDRNGYVVVSGLVNERRRQSVLTHLERLFELEGPHAGSEFLQETGARRLANLVQKSDVLAECIALPSLLAYIAAVIGSRMKLSSLNARSANPENGVTQPLHADGGARPDAQGPWVCNAIWMLDDFHLDNGPLRAVPGTHTDPRLPQDALTDALATHPQEQIITGQAGDVLILNGHLWHGGLPNKTSSHRRALHVYFCRRDKPQQQYQRALLSPERQKKLPPLQRWLCALDDLENDRLSAQVIGRSGFLTPDGSATPST